MKRIFTAAVIVLIAFLSLSVACKKDDNGNGDSIDAMETEVFNLVNEYRTNNSLGTLTRSSVIDHEAKTHSENMADGTVPYGHDGLTTRILTIINAIGGTDASENVGVGQTTAEEIVNDWVASPAHKSNLEGNYTHTGVGIAKNSNGVYYFTQIYLLK